MANAFPAWTFVSHLCVPPLLSPCGQQCVSLLHGGGCMSQLGLCVPRGCKKILPYFILKLVTRDSVPNSPGIYPV